MPRLKRQVRETLRGFNISRKNKGEIKCL
jgi:hypothetical protein